MRSMQDAGLQTTALSAKLIIRESGIIAAITAINALPAWGVVFRYFRVLFAVVRTVLYIVWYWKILLEDVFARGALVY